MQRQFDYEMIEHAIRAKQVSRALYLALKMRTSSPEDRYLTATIGRCLNELYNYQKRHELSRIVDLPGPGRVAGDLPAAPPVQGVRGKPVPGRS